jgi:hypothetical protein
MKSRQLFLGIALTLFTVCVPVQSFAGVFYSPFTVSLALAQTTATGPQPITTQNLNPATGTPTAASFAVPPQLYNMSTVQIQITGTYTCTGGFVAQVTVDNVNWVALSAVTPAQVLSISSGATGIWTANIAGFSGFRLSANGAVTGTATVTMTTTPLLSTVGGGSGGGGGGSVTQGTSPWVTSGTTNATIVGPLGQSNAAGSLPVVQAFNDQYSAGGSITAADIVTTVTNNLTVGTATPGSTYTVTTNGIAGVTFHLTGTGTRTAVFEGSSDGTGTVFATPLTAHYRGANTFVTSVTLTGDYTLNSAGFDHVRIRFTAWTTTNSVSAVATSGVPSVAITNGQVTEANSAAILTQGTTTASSVSNAQMSVGMVPVGATYERASSDGTPITTNTTVQMLASGGAGKYHHVWIDFSNSSSTGTEIEILDGSTVVYDFWCAPSGGGLSDAKPLYLGGLTAATALSIKTITTGASIYWNVRGYYSAYQY